MVKQYDIQNKMSDNMIQVNPKIQTDLLQDLGNNLSMMDINLRIKKHNTLRMWHDVFESLTNTLKWPSQKINKIRHGQK